MNLVRAERFDRFHELCEVAAFKHLQGFLLVLGWDQCASVGAAVELFANIELAKVSNDSLSSIINILVVV